MGIWGKIKDGAEGAWDAYKKPYKQAWDWYNGATDRDPFGYNEKRGAQGDAASGFADQAQDRFGALGGQLGSETDYLRKVARGEESVSQMQLAQALGRNQAQQQSMAAAARPQNAAMAARTAAMNSARLGAGLAGQQAVAGLQERQQANRALVDALMRQREQELNASLQGRANAINAFGGSAATAAQTPTGGEKLLGLIQSGAQIAAMSDRRLKTDIEDGSEDSDKLLRALKSYSFSYNDEKYGKGKQLGVMAQDLEKVLPQAVFDTPEGKAVHGAKLATAVAAMLPGMNKRIESLEGGAKLPKATVVRTKKGSKK